MITTGCCCFAWCRTKRNPDITVSDEPKTTKTSPRSTSAYAASTRGLRHRLAEEHHIGLEPPAAAQTTDQPKLLPVPRYRITVRPQLGMLQNRRLVELRVRTRATDAAVRCARSDPRSPGRRRWRYRHAG